MESTTMPVHAPQPTFYCHFIRVSSHGLQIGVAVVQLDRITADTYRATVPSVHTAGEHSVYVSDSAHPAQATRISQLLPFHFRPREALASVPHARSCLPVIRTRSKELLHRHGSSLSPSPSSSPAPHLSSNAPQVSREAHETRPGGDTPPDSGPSVDTASHEREFIVSLIHRMQQMEQTVEVAQTHAGHVHRSSSSPLGFFASTNELAASPLLTLLTPNPLTPTHALSPLNQQSQLPFHLMPQQSQSLFPPPPNRGPHAHSRSADQSTAPLSSPALTSSFTLHDLKSCILDAPGEDLIESLLLCMLRKMMEIDARGHALVKAESAAAPANTVASTPILLSAAEARDGNGRQLIHFVAGLGYTNLLSLLLSHLSADVNSPDASGRTPLHYAALAEDGFDSDLGNSPAAMMVSALLSYGADDSVADCRGFTPLALADAANRRSVVQVFLEVQNAEHMGQDHDDNDQRDHRVTDETVRPIPTSSDVLNEEDELCEDMADEMPEDDEEDGDEAMFATTVDTSTTTAASSGSGGVGGFFPLDRAFSSLTLHDMGINAQDFLLPSPDGAPSTALSASALFSSPTPHFSRVVSAIQRQIRWWLFRRHAAANKLQSVARGMLARRSMKRMREASLTIQSKFRQRRVRRDFVKLQRATRFIQEKFRGARGEKGLEAQEGSESDGMNATRRRVRHDFVPTVTHNEPFHFPSDPPSAEAEFEAEAEHLSFPSQPPQSLQPPSLDFHLHSSSARASAISPDPLVQLLRETAGEFDYDALGSSHDDAAGTMQRRLQQADNMMMT
jgi:hypothetical protein